MNTPNHKIYFREEFFGMAAYNSLDKHYYFLDKPASAVLCQFFKNGKENKDWAILKKELLKNKLFSNDILLISKKKKSSFSAPLRVFIDITHKCNLRCKHCFTTSGGVDPGELETKTILGLLDQMKESGCFLFSIAGGEPLLRQDIFKIIKHARDNSIDVSITTNGLLVTEEIARRLNDLDLKTITVSVDGLEKNHDAIRGFGTFARVLKNIEILRRVCVNSGLSLKMTVNSLNIGDGRAFVRLGESLGVDSVKFNFIRPFGRVLDCRELLLTRDQYINFITDALKIRSKIGIVLPKTPLDDIDYEFIECGFGCTGGKETCNIDYSGNFSPCAFLGKDYTVGNIKNESLAGLWDKARRISRFEGNDTCLRCEKYAKCRAGCRSRALFGYGNVDAIDPFCVLKANDTDQKISVRPVKDGFVVYDHTAKTYKKYPSWAGIKKDHKKAAKNKQFREIGNKHDVPLRVFFDATNKCNSKCIHCYNDSGRAIAGEISLDIVEKMASEMRDLGIFQVSIAGGEPFMRDDIFDIIRIFNKNLIDVSITTNGLLLDKEKTDRLAGLDIKSITVSIDGTTKEKYEKIRGVDGFLKLKKNIDYLREKFKGELAMRFSVMKGNCVPFDVADFAIGKKFDCLKINKTHPLGRFKGNSRYSISDREYDSLIEEFRKLDIKDKIELEIPREKYLNKGPLPCSAGRKTIYVDSVANVFPCSFTGGKYLLGNLVGDRFSSILARARKFSVDNNFCADCPAMKKSHNITKRKVI